MAMMNMEVEREPTVVQIKGCSVLLPNNQSSSIDHRLVNIPISIQGVDTIMDFKVWNGARYDVILGMAWLREVDAWIACKEGVVHRKLQNGKNKFIKDKRSLPNIPLLSSLANEEVN
jgi:hypothetical protein